MGKMTVEPFLGASHAFLATPPARHLIHTPLKPILFATYGLAAHVLIPNEYPPHDIEGCGARPLGQWWLR